MSAPVLVLLHAFPLSSAMFDRLLPLLPDGVRVLPVDLPGLGAAAVPDEPPSVAAMARGVLAAMDDAGVDRAAVLGISTGGYVALALADLAPDRVAALVLGSTTCWVGEPDLPDERRALADEVERTGSTDAVLDAADAGLGPTAHRDQPELRDLLRAVIADADPAGVAWVARAIADRPDTAGVLAAYVGPVLLLFGDEDTETPAALAERMAALRPARLDTRVVVLRATGHLTALERPDAVADAVLGLVGRVGRVGRVGPGGR